MILSQCHMTVRWVSEELFNTWKLDFRSFLLFLSRTLWLALRASSSLSTLSPTVDPAELSRCSLEGGGGGGGGGEGGMSILQNCSRISFIIVKSYTLNEACMINTGQKQKRGKNLTLVSARGEGIKW